MQTHDLDIAIFGAGIAGLWTLARLHKAGYRVALFERNALGGVQSIASQGIIHGGTKYALTGKLTGSAMAIGEMPDIWRAALDGRGEIDLSDVRVLTEHQHLWSTGSLASGIAGFFAGKVMQSRMQTLSSVDYPPPFDVPGFHGSLYRLQEPVLDTRSLFEVLARQYGHLCRQVGMLPVCERKPGGWRCQVADEVTVDARAIVLAAGAGNANLLAALGQVGPAMQRRPLAMLMARGDFPELYAHCLGASANPRLTVTSYPCADGQVMWYLGGQVAEQGTGRSRAAQIEAGRAELAELLPRLDLTTSEWAVLPIDRAEIATPGGRRPDDAFVGMHDDIITCWPTKLAFAPRVASQAISVLEQRGIAARGGDADLSILPSPPLAVLPWDEVTEWS